ncbi:unnamed protein product [Symbiodinium sp. KB8]|nr:unnamed protein product [Symbiodinium sp. KB8]
MAEASAPADQFLIEAPAMAELVAAAMARGASGVGLLVGRVDERTTRTVTDAEHATVEVRRRAVVEALTAAPWAGAPSAREPWRRPLFDAVGRPDLSAWRASIEQSGVAGEGRVILGAWAVDRGVPTALRLREAMAHKHMAVLGSLCTSADGGRVRLAPALQTCWASHATVADDNSGGSATQGGWYGAWVCEFGAAALRKELAALQRRAPDLLAAAASEAEPVAPAAAQETSPGGSAGTDPAVASDAAGASTPERPAALRSRPRGMSGRLGAEHRRNTESAWATILQDELRSVAVEVAVVAGQAGAAAPRPGFQPLLLDGPGGEAAAMASSRAVEAALSTLREAEAAIFGELESVASAERAGAPLSIV